MQTPTQNRPLEPEVPRESFADNKGAPTTKKTSPLIPLGVLAALLVGGLFIRSRMAGKSDAPKGPARDSTRSVKVVTASTGTIIENLVVTGQLRSNQNVDLNAKISGRVAKVLVEEGQRVKNGQVVVQLDTQDLRQALDAARANLRQTQVALQQTQVGLPARVAQVDTAIAQAQAALANARAGVATAQARYQQALLNEPARITNTRSQAAAARAQLASAQAALKGAGDTVNQTKSQVASGIDAARANLGSARAQLDQVKNGSRAQEVARAQAAVNLAEAQRLDAQTNLNRQNQLFAGGATAQANVDSAKTALAVAQANLESVSQQLSLVKAGARTEEVRAAEGVVAQREAALQTALADRGRLLTAQSQANQALQAVAQAQEGVRQAQANQANIPITQQETLAAQEAVRQAQSQVRTAAAALNQAKANRTQIPVAQADVPAAQARVAAAQTQVEQAKLNLSYATITSPVNGVVNTKNTDVGETAAPGTPLLNLVALDSVYFEAQVPETQLSSIKLNQPARITVTSVSQEPVIGYVTKIIPVADQRLRQFRVRISLPQDAKLTPGAFARGILQTQVINNTLTLPETLVHSQDGKSVVYVAVPDGEKSKIEVKTVKTGASANGKIQIVGGIKEGDQVVDSSSQFENDEKVKIVKS